MKLMALLYFVLSLFGCDPGGSTYVTRTVVDGADTLYSRATTQAGVARFECLRSTSGQCYYTVLPRECAPATTAKTPTSRAALCPSEPIERFAIAKGDSRQIAGLQGFRLCVSAEGGAAGSECVASEVVGRQ